MSINDKLNSLNSELNRINSAKADIASAITAKGVAVPAGTSIDGYAGLIGNIQQGGGSDNGIPTFTVSLTGDEKFEQPTTTCGYVYQTGVNNENLNVDCKVSTAYNLVPGSYNFSVYAPAGYTATLSSGQDSGTVDPGQNIHLVYNCIARTDCILTVRCITVGPYEQYYSVDDAEWTIDDGETWIRTGTEKGGITFKKDYTMSFSEIPGYKKPDDIVYSMGSVASTGYNGEPKNEIRVEYSIDFKDAYYINSHSNSAVVGKFTKDGEKTYDGITTPVFTNGTYWLAVRNSMQGWNYHLLPTRDDAYNTTSYEYEVSGTLGYSTRYNQPCDTFYKSVYDSSTGSYTNSYFDVALTAIDDSELIVSGSDGYDGSYAEYTGGTGKARKWKNADTGMVICASNSSGSSWYFVPQSQSDYPGMNMSDINASSPGYQPPYNLDGTSRRWKCYDVDPVSGMGGEKVLSISIIPSAGTALIDGREVSAPSGAAWTIDGINWIPFGRTWRVNPGEYTLRFKEINGYTTPASQAITASVDTAIVLAAEYTERTDLTTVTVTPDNDYDTSVSDTTKSSATWSIVSKTDGVPSPVGKFTGEATVKLQPGDYVVKGDTCNGYNCGPTYLELHNQNGGNSYAVPLIYTTESAITYQNAGMQYGYPPWAAFMLRFKSGEEVTDVWLHPMNDGTSGFGHDGWIAKPDGSSQMVRVMYGNSGVTENYCRVHYTDITGFTTLFSLESSDNPELQAENANYFYAWNIVGVRIAKDVNGNEAEMVFTTGW